MTVTATVAEAVARAALGLVASHPGQFGRLRTARVIAGYAVDHDGPAVTSTTTPYASVAIDWTIRDTVALIDATINGGLLTQTAGPRPTLVFTQPEFRALDALACTQDGG